MNRILGTSFEMSLRILIMLSEASEEGLTIEKIAALDFIAVYAADFNLAQSNLHGYSSYRFGEFPGRRELGGNAIKQLVLDGMVLVEYSKDGFIYRLSKNGYIYATNLESLYAEIYRKLITDVIVATNEKSESELFELIYLKTIDSLREG